MAPPDLPSFSVAEADLDGVQVDVFGLICNEIQAWAVEYFDADLGTDLRYGPGTWLH